MISDAALQSKLEPFGYVVNLTSIVRILESIFPDIDETILDDIFSEIQIMYYDNRAKDETDYFGKYDNIKNSRETGEGGSAFKILALPRSVEYFESMLCFSFMNEGFNGGWVGSMMGYQKSVFLYSKERSATRNVMTGATSHVVGLRFQTIKLRDVYPSVKESKLIKKKDKEKENGTSTVQDMCQLAGLDYHQLKTRDDSKTDFDGYASTKFYEALYNILLFKERWKQESTVVGKYPYNLLYRYLINVSFVIRKLMQKNDGDSVYYGVSECDGDKYVIYDCGLLDKYANKIILIHKLQKYVDNGKVSVRFINPKIVSNKSELKQYGFDSLDLNMLRYFKYDALDDFIFRHGINDVDFCDVYRLQHIITDRNTRLPVSLRERNEVEVFSRLQTSIEFALKVQSVDYTFIAPTYDFTSLGINYMIPFYVDFDLNKPPECAILLVRQEDGKFVPVTILDMDMAYSNARLLGMPVARWLR